MTGEVADASLRAGDGGLLQLLGDVHVDAVVLMFAELFLQRCDELAEGLLLIGHDVREQQRVEQAITFGEMLADADAA